MNFRNLMGVYIVISLVIPSHISAKTIKDVTQNTTKPSAIWSLRGSNIDDILSQSDFEHIDVSNVRLLNLTNNRIRGLGPETFKKFTNLKVILLGDNPLDKTNIDKTAFHGLNNLWFLGIGGNKNSSQALALKRYIQTQIPDAYIYRGVITQRILQWLAITAVALGITATVAIKKTKEVIRNESTSSDVPAVSQAPLRSPEEEKEERRKQDALEAQERREEIARDRERVRQEKQRRDAEEEARINREAEQAAEKRRLEREEKQKKDALEAEQRRREKAERLQRQREEALQKKEEERRLAEEKEQAAATRQLEQAKEKQEAREQQEQQRRLRNEARNAQRKGEPLTPEQRDALKR